MHIFIKIYLVIGLSISVIFYLMIVPNKRKNGASV